VLKPYMYNLLKQQTFSQQVSYAVNSRRSVNKWAMQ